MRIVQLIDSLEAGGAERMAVNYANELASQIDFSGLVVSRKEGMLCELVNKNVNYLFLNRKSTFDLKALFRLKSFVKINNIEIIHAHGTSFFLGFLLKLVFFRIKLVWHDHLGSRINQSLLQNIVLLLASFFFSKIIVVNNQLREWVSTKLFTSNVEFIPNFAFFDPLEIAKTNLKGVQDKRIAMIANLKNPKNHFYALNSFYNSNIALEGWSLHFVGKDFNDEYSNLLKKFILKNKLQNSVFLYGAQSDIKNILSQTTIGILTSTAEGFPVTLLEYATMRLPIISTNVGFCNQIINHGVDSLLFNPEDINALENYFVKIPSDIVLWNTFAINLHKKIKNQYSEQKVIQQLILCYKTL